MDENKWAAAVEAEVGMLVTDEAGEDTSYGMEAGRSETHDGRTEKLGVDDEMVESEGEGDAEPDEAESKEFF